MCTRRCRSSHRWRRAASPYRSIRNSVSVQAKSSSCRHGDTTDNSCWRRPLRLLLFVALQRLGSDFGAVDVARRVHRDAFRRAGAGRLFIGVWDERNHLAGLDASDADAPLPAVMISRYRSGFGVGDVDHVVLVDKNSAGSAELAHLPKELSFLIENLDAIVVTITYKKPAFGIERQRVGLVEFTGARSQFAPLLDELSVLGEFQNAIVAAPMPFGNKDVAVFRDDHVVRLIEITGRCRAAGRAERQQQLSVLTELENLVAFGRAGRRADGSGGSRAARRRTLRGRVAALRRAAAR